MANAIRSLVCNITITDTWTQLLEEVAGTAYTVPATGHADVKSLIVTNNGANSVAISMGISADGTISDLEGGLPKCTLAAIDEHAEYDGVIVIVAGKGLWVKAVGTTPNISVRAAAYEVVP